MPRGPENEHRLLFVATDRGTGGGVQLLQTDVSTPCKCHIDGPNDPRSVVYVYRGGVSRLRHKRSKS